MAPTRRPGSTPRAPRRTASSRAGGSASARPTASRPSPRPAAAARGRRPPGELHTSRSIKAMVILASIFVMLAVTLIPTLRSTLNQQSQINELSSHLAQKRATVAALQEEQRQWTDPAYVEQQARERLKFVRVGETSYTVIDAEAPPVDAGGPKIVASAQAAGANTPWYGQMWRSMVIADTSASSAPARHRTSSTP